MLNTTTKGPARQELSAGGRAAGDATVSVLPVVESWPRCWFAGPGRWLRQRAKRARRNPGTLGRAAEWIGLSEESFGKCLSSREIQAVGSGRNVGGPRQHEVMSSPAFTPSRHPVAEALERLHAELDAIAADPGVVDGRHRGRGRSGRGDPARRQGGRAGAAGRRTRRPPRGRVRGSGRHRPRTGGRSATRQTRAVDAPQGASSRSPWTASTSRCATRWRPARPLPEQAQVIVDAVDALPTDLVEPEVDRPGPDHADRVCPRPRPQGPEDPGPADPRRRRPRGRGGPRGTAARGRGTTGRRARCGSPWPTTGTAAATAGSPSPPCTGEMLRKQLLATAAPKHRAATGRARVVRWSRSPRWDRAAVCRSRLGQASHRVDRALPRRPAPHRRRHLGHRGGHYDPGHADGRSRRRLPGHRRRHLTGPGTPAGVRGRDHPRRPRRRLPGPRPRPQTTPPQGTPTDRPRPARQGLHPEGCDAPPGLCHAHHQLPWSKGGNTSLDNGRLLCPRHHTLAHDPHYATNTRPNGKITFTRRT